MDGRWTYNADAPVCSDSGNSNNYVDVVCGEGYDALVRSRLLAPEARMTETEKQRILVQFSP